MASSLALSACASGETAALADCEVAELAPLSDWLALADCEAAELALVADALMLLAWPHAARQNGMLTARSAVTRLVLILITSRSLSEVGTSDARSHDTPFRPWQSIRPSESSGIALQCRSIATQHPSPLHYALPHRSFGPEPLDYNT